MYTNSNKLRKVNGQAPLSSTTCWNPRFPHPRRRRPLRQVARRAVLPQVGPLVASLGVIWTGRMCEDGLGGPEPKQNTQQHDAYIYTYTYVYAYIYTCMDIQLHINSPGAGPGPAPAPARPGRPQPGPTPTRPGPTRSGPTRSDLSRPQPEPELGPDPALYSLACFSVVSRYVCCFGLCLCLCCGC